MDDLDKALALLSSPTERRRLRHQHLTRAAELDDALDEFRLRAHAAGDTTTRATLLEELERLARRWGFETLVALARGAERGAQPPLPGPFRGSPSLMGVMPSGVLHETLRSPVMGRPRGPSLESLDPASPMPPPSEPPSPLVAYPELRGPNRVRITEVFDVQVRTRAKPPHEGAPAVTLARSEPGPVTVTARLRVPPGSGLVATGSDHALLEIPDGRDSAAVSFELRAERRGTWPVEVALEDLLGVTITRLVREVPVSEEAVTGVPVVAVSSGMPLAFQAQPSQGLVLKFDADGEGFVATLQGVLPGWAMPPRSQPVKVTDKGFTQLANLCRNLLDLSGYDDISARERQLEDIGRSLAEVYLPRELRDELASASLAEGVSLHIESDDAWIPWEVLWITTRGGGFFLGERFAVTRGLRRQSLRVEGRRTPACLVHAFEGELSPTQPELVALGALAGVSPAVARTFTEAQKWLRSAEPAGVIHFACHGSSSTSPLGASLKLREGLLRPANVPPMERHDATGAAVGALVFLNACQSGTPTEGAVASDATTWPQAFMAGGAAACVATSWNVLSATAAAFAADVYGRLAEGLTLAEAVRRARATVRRVGEPDRLAWGVYALPSFRLGRGET